MSKLALISVSNKSNIVDFAKSIVEKHGYKIISTGGTAKLLQESGIPVTQVAEHTGFPELMGGRIKSLHPKIHGGILCKRTDAAQIKDAQENAIPLISLVVVNLYPFEQTIQSVSATFDDAIENIDIGGPTMLRSAAKNHESVTVICDPADYARAAENLESPALRRELALKAFEHTAKYDRAIANYLQSHQEEPSMESISGMPKEFHLTLKKDRSLRYGENPHQQAALYGRFSECFEQLQGKELSYNNILDISEATYLIGEFEKPTVGILKHTNPCGIASSLDIEEAWEQALATDKKSPFGGIIVLNQTLEAGLANKIKDLFCEVIIAPGFTPEAIEIFSAKKNLRLMAAKDTLNADSLLTMRSVVGGILIQDRDHKSINSGSWEVVTKRQPTEEEWASMLFGMRVVKHVKSNAIVYAKGERTLGIGAGQMSRIDSSAIAVRKAQEAGLSLKGAAIASDAFFPFPDALLEAVKSGITCAAQPGGSKGDQAVIDAANENNIAMVFTKKRHFLH